jgi:hypothetical protein
MNQEIKSEKKFAGLEGQALHVCCGTDGQTREDVFFD